MTPEEVVRRFNDRITARDVDGLASLMTEDHAFVDMAGESVEGKDACLDAWSEFFAEFPDYENVFERVSFRGDLVVLQGYSTCPDDRMDGPALWTARVSDDRLSEWRVYEDTAENRRRLGIDD